MSLATIYKKVINKIIDYGHLVMFSHTIFSLAFAAVALLVASKGMPNPMIVVWAGIALISARTGANAINRVIDAKIDKMNPRTAGRQIPSGQLSSKEAIILTVLCFAAMVVAAFMLNPLCAALSPIALFLMIIYSYTKRFTWLCHLVLGVTCACAPAGAWLAVTGTFSLEVFVLGGASTLWTAGFDIIYATQDYDFDRENKIYSIPARFGIGPALWISTIFHMGAVVGLVLFGILQHPFLGFWYFLGIIIIIGLMIAQHTLVTPEHLKNVELASYNISQITSIVLLIFGVIDVYF